MMLREQPLWSTAGRALLRPGDDPLASAVPTGDRYRQFLYRQIARAHQAGDSRLVDDLLEKLFALRETPAATDRVDE